MHASPSGSTSAGTPTPAGTPAGIPDRPPDRPPVLPTDTTPTTVKSKYQRNMKVLLDISSFKGDNVRAYLRKYNLLAEDYDIEERQKLSRYTAYYADEIVAEVESRARYKLGD